MADQIIHPVTLTPHIHVDQFGEVEPRRLFIEQNAKFASNLDI